MSTWAALCSRALRTRSPPSHIEQLLCAILRPEDPRRDQSVFLTSRGCDVVQRRPCFLGKEPELFIFSSYSITLIRSISTYTTARHHGLCDGLEVSREESSVKGLLTHRRGSRRQEVSPIAPSCKWPPSWPRISEISCSYGCPHSRTPP